MKRRVFLKSSALFAGVQILPRNLLAEAPNSKLNVAHIGLGGMGNGDLNSVSDHKQVNIVGLCDVDLSKAEAAGKNHASAKLFSDYRDMIASMGNQIDAVVVSTADHAHAPVAMTALNNHKHVYCQKPLTHEVFESRRLREVAEKNKLVTQMGIQIHAHVAYRMATEMIQNGVIGKVSEVHAWSNKNWGTDKPAPEGVDPVPEKLDWDAWCGVAPVHPYKNGVYHPGQWRKILDYGCGTLGDMGVHIFDTPYRALKLTAPNWVKTSCRKPTGFGHPERNIVEYEFPKTEYTAETMKWKWYDGGFAPPKDMNWPLPPDYPLPSQGSVFVGELGILLLPHIGGPQLFPKERFTEVERPKPPYLNHYHQWVDACLGLTETSAHFGYSGPLTEALLLGVVANRFPDTVLKWDAANMKITNLDEANQYIRRTYRKGYEVENL